MSSALTLVNLALDELVLSRMLSGELVGTSDAARLFLSLLNRQGRALRDAKEGGWTIMQRLYTFPTVASQDEYVLPADYVKFINDTVWNRSLLTRSAGPLSPAQWQTIKSGLVGTGAYSNRYRVVRSATSAVRKFVVDPVPTAIEMLAFEYLSTDWATDVTGATTKRAVTVDTDDCLFDDDLMVMGLIWRYKRAKGFEYVSALAEYNEELDRAMADDVPAGGISLSGPEPHRFIGYANIPDHDYG